MAAKTYPRSGFSSRSQIYWLMSPGSAQDLLSIYVLWMAMFYRTSQACLFFFFLLHCQITYLNNISNSRYYLSKLDFNYFQKMSYWIVTEWILFLLEWLLFVKNTEFKSMRKDWTYHTSGECEYLEQKKMRIHSSTFFIDFFID